MTEDGPTYDESMNYNAALVAKGREMTTPKELAAELWEALKEQCARTPDKSLVKMVLSIREEHVVAAVAALRAAPPAEPVACWRWRPKGAQGAWIYDPTPQWLEDNMASIEAQPLYASPIPVAHMTYDGIVTAYDEYKKTFTVMMDQPPNFDSYSQGYVAGWNAKETQIGAEPVALRQALEEIIKLSGSNAPTWESVTASLEWEEDDDVISEVYYTRKAYWEIGKVARAALQSPPVPQPETKS